MTDLTVMRRENIVNQLAQMEVFNKFPQEVLNQLTEMATIQKLKKGEFLCHQGDVWQYVFFLAKGYLEWTILSFNGNEFILFSLESNEIFWGHSIFDNEPMPASLVATRNSTVYSWHRDSILPFLYKYPETLWELTGILTRRMREAREIIYSLTFQHVPGRLAKLLLEYFSDPEVNSVKRNLTLRSIATRISASPEVVCRIFQRMELDDILELTRENIILLDREALKDLAYSEKQ